MAWEKERRHLSSKTPERVSFVQWPRAGISVLIRRFPVVFEKTEEESAVSFLSQFGDPDAPAPATTVENPIAGGKSYGGVYRSVKVEAGKIKGREDTQGIYQTLVAGSFRETGWIRVENNCQFVVDHEVYWSTDVRPPLPANSPGVEYSYAQHAYDRETGLYVVIIERRTRLYQYDSRVSEISPLASSETTQQLGVTTQAVAPLLDERGVIARRTTSLNRDCSKDHVTETDRARPFGPFLETHGGPLVRETVSLLANQLQPPSPGPGGAGFLHDVSPSINRYGLIDSQATTRQALPFGPWVSTHGGPLVRESVEGDLNQPAALNPGAGGTGVQIDVAQNANTFGLYDRTKTTRTAVPFGPWVSTHGGPLVTEVVTGDLNQSAPLSPGPGAAGYQVDVSQGANTFGLYDRTKTVRQAMPFGPWVSTHGGPLVRETIEGDLNQAAPLNPGPGAAGYQVDVSQGANPFGLYDRTKTTRQALPFGPWTSVHGGPLVEETVIGDLNQAGPLSPGAGGAGYQVDVSQGANPFGLYDRTMTTRRAVPFGPWTSIHGGPLVRETVRGDLNQPDALNPGPGGSGVTIDVAQGANPFGLYDRTMTTRTAVPFGPWSSVHGSPLVRETVDGDLNQPGPLSPGQGSAGVTIDVAQGVNPFGLYDRTKTTRQALPFGPWTSTHGGVLVRETVAGDLNQSSALNPGPGAAGYQVDVSQSVNPFGLYDRVKTERQAIPFGPWTSTHGGAVVTETVEGDLNQPAALNPGAGSVGTTIDVSQSVNPFGLFDRVKTTRRANPFNWSWTAGGPIYRESVSGYQNAGTGQNPGAGGSGVVTDVNQSLNAFGLFDGAVITRTALPFGPWTSVHGGPLVRETVEGALNQPGALSPGAGGSGVTIDVSQSANNYGLYDRTKTTREALPFGPWSSVHGSPLVRETVEGALNQPAAISPGAGAAGFSIDVSQNVNPFGLYDRVKTTREALPADTGWIATTEDSGFRSETRTFRNQSLAAVQAIAQTIGGNYRGRCFAHYNDYGLLDGSANRSPKLVQMGGFDTPANLNYAVKYEKPRDGYSYTVSEKITSSPSTAESHANNTLTHVGSIYGGVRYLGNGIYKSVKIS